MLNLCTTLLFSDPNRTHFNFRDVSCEVINPRLNMALQILVIQVFVYIEVVPKAIFYDSDHSAVTLHSNKERGIQKPS